MPMPHMQMSRQWFYFSSAHSEYVLVCVCMHLHTPTLSDLSISPSTSPSCSIHSLFHSGRSAALFWTEWVGDFRKPLQSEIVDSICQKCYFVAEQNNCQDYPLVSNYIFFFFCKSSLKEKMLRMYKWVRKECEHLEVFWRNFCKVVVFKLHP